jgi:hypothetical protein
VLPHAEQGAGPRQRPRQRQRTKQRRADATGRSQGRLRREPTRARWRNRTKTSQVARGNTGPWQSNPRALLVIRRTMRQCSGRRQQTARAWRCRFPVAAPSALRRNIGTVSRRYRLLVPESAVFCAAHSIYIPTRTRAYAENYDQPREVNLDHARDRATRSKALAMRSSGRDLVPGRRELNTSCEQPRAAISKQPLAAARKRGSTVLHQGDVFFSARRCKQPRVARPAGVAARSSSAQRGSNATASAKKPH